MMMMTNDQAKEDLIGYAKITLWSTCAIVLALLTATMFAYVVNRLGLMNFFLGTLIGAVLAVSNLFAIGYAFYRLAIKKERRFALLVPLATFLTMGFLACGLALFWTTLLLGFAVGLLAPVIIGAVLVYLSRKPA